MGSGRPIRIISPMSYFKRHVFLLHQIGVNPARSVCAASGLRGDAGLREGQDQGTAAIGSGGSADQPFRLPGSMRPGPLAWSCIRKRSGTRISTRRTSTRIIDSQPGARARSPSGSCFRDRPESSGAWCRGTGRPDRGWALDWPRRPDARRYRAYHSPATRCTGAASITRFVSTAGPGVFRPWAGWRCVSNFRGRRRHRRSAHDDGPRRKNSTI